MDVMSCRWEIDSYGMPEIPYRKYTDHSIVAVDGQSPDLHGRAFLVWFRLRHEPGDEVTLTLREGKALRKITYRLPLP